MVWNLEPISLGIGAGIIFLVWLIITIILKSINKKKEPTKTTLPQLKSYAQEAYNHMVESANNLVRLYEVFNEIEESKK